MREEEKREDGVGLKEELRTKRPREPAGRRMRWKDGHFRSSLGHAVSSRPAWVTEQNPVSTKTKWE